tara:strand:+ start:408 stop:812 length:405 start_codon:yes stop_codon:yes gene_type:complete
LLGKLNHIAIAVPNLNNAINTYQNILDVKIGEQIEQPLHGVKVAFIELPNAKIELLEPLGDNSPIIKFLQKNKNGGIHHVCYEVKDIIKSRNQILKNGGKVAGSIEPRIGAHGKLVIFLHPENFNGTLIELEQI